MTKEFCFESENTIFSLIFRMKSNSIHIECKDIESQSNEKYINELLLKDWKDYNNYLSSFNNISDIFHLIEKLDLKDFSITKEKNQLNLTIKFSDFYHHYPVNIMLDNINSIKTKDIKSNKSNDSIEENIILKDKDKELEKRTEMLEDQLKKLKIILCYNLIDVTLLELDNVFNNLESKDLISKREHLGFINSGIKKIFKNNIANCRLVFKFPTKDNNIYNNVPNIIRAKCEGLKNPLIIVKTTNLKVFGALYAKNNLNNQSIGNNQINNMIETIFDSRYYTRNSFIFSLDNFKIYYSDPSYKYLCENPEFEIKYNKYKTYFLGNEYVGKEFNYIPIIEQPEYENYEGEIIETIGNYGGNLAQRNINVQNIQNTETISPEPRNNPRVNLNSQTFNNYNNGNNNIINDNNYNQYSLSGMEEFIISNLEIFDIILNE